METTRFLRHVQVYYRYPAAGKKYFSFAAFPPAGEPGIRTAFMSDDTGLSDGSQRILKTATRSFTSPA
ncbi:MAG: hypothetical protein LUQ71_10460 [Methanoregula sp.]|nr:hypothetical protein [Methanoregula sp.]